MKTELEELRELLLVCNTRPYTYTEQILILLLKRTIRQAEKEQVIIEFAKSQAKGGIMTGDM